MSAAWHTLKSDTNTLPRLLLKADLSRAGHSVILTDLNRVWKQALSKDAVIAYAKTNRTVIDPSEDDEQYDILSTKLRDALHQHDGTFLSIAASKAESLVLDVSTPMPKPLAPLQWTFHLTQAPDPAVADTIVYPLLERAQVLKQQMDRLLAELQAKDKVISRITDKLERSAYDLTDVFPVAAGVKLNKERSQREQLSRYVPGLGKFDRNAWSGELAVIEAASGAVCIGEDLRAAQDGHWDGDEWWRKLRGSVALANADQPPEFATSHPNLVTDSQERHEVVPDNDFQRQVTPPRLHVTQSEAKDEPRSDSDDLDRPSQASRVGGRQSRSASNKEPEVQTGSLPDADDGSETEGEEIAPLPKSSPRKVIKTRSSSPVAQPSPPASYTLAVPSTEAKKLGVLGGRKRVAAFVEEVTPPSTIEETASKTSKPRLGTLGGKTGRKESSTQPMPPSTKSSSPAKAKKLGTIGGGSAVSHTPTADFVVNAPEATPRASRATSRATPVVDEVCETSVERANRKRDELKKAIEEKAKVPVKKKRKF